MSLIKQLTEILCTSTKYFGSAILVGLPLTVNAGDSASSESPLKIHTEDSYNMQFDSPQLQRIGEITEVDYRLEYGGQKSITITAEKGSKSLAFKIDQLMLMEGDYITVKSPITGEKHRYKHDDLPEGGWTLSVQGHVAIIKLHQKNGQPSDGMSYDNVIISQQDRLYSDDELPSLKVCGNQDWADAKCYKDSNADMFNASNAVARLIIRKNNGSFYCTGWRIKGRNDVIVTNHHCISNNNHATNTEVQFNYKRAACNGSTFSPNVVKVRGTGLVVANSGKDVAMFTINNPSKVSKYGALDIANRAPSRGEEIYIPQHPSGKPKKISRDSSQDNNGACIINSTSNNEARYFCDTAGGSSGSPVLLKSNNKVIALHHTGNCSSGNGGVRMDRVWSVISPYL